MPKEWRPKIIRKIQASNEVLHKVLGSIDTPEKFQAKRHKLAEHEWARMRANDRAGPARGDTHSVAFSQGKTCIDCHKAIAHQLPTIEQETGAPKPVSAKVN